MDGVRLAAPTVLNVKTDTYASGGAAAKAPAQLPAGVLLVVAQGGHRIAFHHPSSTKMPNIHGFNPQVLANLLLTNSALFEQLFDLTVGEIRLVGWPLSLQDVVPVVGLLRKPKMEDAMTSESRLRALNVVFVLSARPEVGDEAKYEHTLVGCRIDGTVRVGPGCTVQIQRSHISCAAGAGIELNGTADGCEVSENTIEARGGAGIVVRQRQLANP